MISIFHNRYRSDGTRRSEADGGASEALGRLALGLIENVCRYVLTGDGYEKLRQQMDGTREALLQAGSEEAIGQADSAVARILAEYRADSQQAAMAQAVEVQHIFALLNHALIVMSDGRDRSVSRLSDIQTQLERTSKLRDIVAMKSALADTVKFVEREASEARKVVTEELARLETEVGAARDFMANTRTELAGRAEGIAKIREWIPLAGPDQAVYAVAYQCSNLTAITQRYGANVSEEMTFRVIRERLQPVAPSAPVYRWTPSGLVAVFVRQRGLAALEAEVMAVNKSPVVHRVARGNRTAVLTMAPSRLVVEGSGAQEAIVAQLDKFMGAIS